MPRGKELGLTFGKAASDYERGRPTYPGEAVEWILERVHPHNTRIEVADLGAGTGKFTRALAAHDIDVIAVEPDAAMRETLAASVPGIPVLEGSAERIPAADGAFDLVTLAQAWHWVDVEAASVEVARVLAPDGALALVWNIRDESVGWVATLGRIIGSSAAEEFDNANPPVAAPLSRSEYAAFRWTNTMSRDELHAMVTSRSYIIALSIEEQTALLASVDELLDTHPDLAGRTEYAMPYVTHVTIAKRQSS